MTDLERAVAIAFVDPQSSRTDQARALELLSQLPNPAAVRDEKGRTLIHWACRNEWKEVAKALMEEHIRWQLLDPTIVVLAFEYPSTTGIDQARALKLLSQLPNPAAVRDEENETLLHWACRNEWGDVVKFLIENNEMKLEFESILEKKLSSYGTDQASILQLLSWHPNPAVIRGEDGRSLLYLACQKGWGNIAKKLLEMAQSDSALDPTTVCLQFRHPSTTGTDQARALKLLSQLPNPAAVRDEKNETLLHWACRNKWGDVVKLLIVNNNMESEFGSILVNKLDWYLTDQASVLQLLSWHPNPAAVRRISDGKGRSLLYLACWMKLGDIAKWLLEMAQSDSALDPTTVCLQFRYPSTTGTDQARALKLLSQLPNPEAARDEKNETLLHLACRNEWGDVVKLLIVSNNMESEFGSILVKKLNWYLTDQASVLQLLSWHPNPAAVRRISDGKGRSLLYLACRMKLGDIAKRLLEMAQSDSALDPTTVCLQFRHPSTTGTDQARALELLSQLPNPAAVRDEENETLLHWACRNEWGDVVKFLIENNKMKLEFESILEKKFSPCGPNQASVLQLLSWHPNPAVIRGEDGRSLLYLACRKGWSDIAKKLLEMAQSDSALDPTTVCLQFEHPSTTGTDQARALELLSQLPNPAAVRDEKGRTLIRWACRNE